MQLLVALFFGVSLVFFMTFEGVKGLLSLGDLTSSMVVSFLLIGLLLFLGSWGTSVLVKRNLESDIAKKELEKKELKAKLYDLEQGVRLKNLDQKLDNKDEDKESSVIRPRQNFK